MSELDTVPRPAPSPEGQTWQETALGGSNPEDTIAVIAPDGSAGTVRRADLAQAMDAGFKLEHPEQTYERALEKEYGDRPIEAGIRSGLSTVTGGLSDLVGGEKAREIRKRNETASMVGGVGAAFLPVGLPGLLTKAGVAAKGLIAGEGLLARTAGAGLQGVTEGVGYGVQSAVSEIGLSKDPVSLEGAALTIGSHALGGGLLGGAVNVGGKLLAEGAGVVKARAAKEMQAITSKVDEVDRGAFPEHANMDAKAASKRKAELVEQHKAGRAADIVEGEAAHKAETEFLGKTRKEAARKVYGEAKEFIEEIRPIKIQVDEGTAGASMDAKVLGTKKKKLMTGLDNARAFEKNLGDGTFLRALEEEETVLKRVLSDADDVLANAEQHQAAYIDALPKRKHELIFEPTATKPNLAPLPDMPALSAIPERPGSALPGSAKEQAWEKAAAEAERLNLKAQQEWEKAVAKVEASNQKAQTAWEKATAATELENVTAQLENAKLYLSPEQARRYGAWSGKEVPKGKSLAVTPEELEGFRQAIEVGDVLAPQLDRVTKAQGLLEKVETMRSKIDDLQSPLASPKLKEIEDRIAVAKADVKPTNPEILALDAHLGDLQTKSMGHRIAQGLGGLVGGSAGMSLMGPAGAMAGAFLGRDVGIRLYERFVRKIVNSNAQRGKTIKMAVASMFEKGATGVAKAMPHASKIIPAVQYNSKEETDAILGPSKAKPSKDPTVNAFRERSRELDSLTEPAMGGKKYQMRFYAKEQMHERMEMLWKYDPDVANAVEKQNIIATEYLASKMPRNPAPPHLEVGPDTWEPSHAQMAQFARLMQIHKEPEVCVKRLAEGTATPDDVEALKTMWPAHYDDVKRQCMERIPLLQSTMPYAKRLTLGILLEIPVDPALTQPALSVYQAPKPTAEEQQSPAPIKALPQGMVQPTASQRISSK